MGSIKKVLANADLPDRELHHSRMFVDLAENMRTIAHEVYATLSRRIKRIYTDPLD